MLSLAGQTTQNHTCTSNIYWARQMSCVQGEKHHTHKNELVRRRYGYIPVGGHSQCRDLVEIISDTSQWLSIYRFLGCRQGDVINDALLQFSCYYHLYRCESTNMSSPSYTIPCGSGKSPQFTNIDLTPKNLFYSLG